MSTRAVAPTVAAPAAVLTPLQRPMLQRTCDCGQHTGGGECDDCKKKKKMPLQRYANGSAAPAIAPPVVHDVLGSHGEPLDASSRNFLETRFPRHIGQFPASEKYLEREAEKLADHTTQSPPGRTHYDLSQIRLHCDRPAAASAKALNAAAYTIGNHIVFARGHYNPATSSGRWLLAHEVAHALQQSTGQRLLQRRSIFQTIGIFLGLTEGDFSDEELLAYLKKVSRAKQIEDSFDSDNKARAIVRKWKSGASAFQLKGEQKILLIREMETGSVSRGDEEGILDLLDYSVNSDLEVIFGPGGVNPAKLRADLGASARKRLDRFFAQRFKGGAAAVLKGGVKAVGAPSGPAELQARFAALEVRRDQLRKQADNLQDQFVESKAGRRSQSDLQEDVARTKKAALSETQTEIPRHALKHLKKAIRVEQTGNTVYLFTRFQLTFLALSEEAGRKQAAIDIPRITNAIQQAWTVELTKGDYEGLTFSVSPEISYRPPTQTRSEDALQILVRGRDDKPSSGTYWTGEIELAQNHLQGDRIVVVAHELYHLFGFFDAYFEITHPSQTDPKKQVTEESVGRSDPANRPDLLGMPDPVLLKKYLAEGKITPAQFKLQTEGKLRVWEEDASSILRGLGVAKPEKKPAAISPESEDYERKQEDLIAAESKKKEEVLAGVRAQRRDVQNCIDWLDDVESILKIDVELQDLRQQLQQVKP